jgi:hypothetical protein
MQQEHAFDELGREPDEQMNSSGQGTESLIQTKPSHVRLNFRDGQVVLSRRTQFNSLASNRLAEELQPAAVIRLSKE